MVIQIPIELFTIETTIPKDQWAPGVWAGCEGLKLTITKIDLDNRIIKLEYKEE